MASTAVGTHNTGPLSLMSCVRESSPEESMFDTDNDKNVVSKRKFWNPRKWFKRKSNKVAEDISPCPEVSETNTKETATVRSRSTSELSETDEPVRRRSGTPMHPGLSVSHDSIFHSPQSGSELELGEAQSSSSLSTQHHPTQSELRLQTELSERLRLRRGRGDTSEDDEGFPRSPCCNSPTSTENQLEKTALKNHPTKSHSTCSDGSLLSMGSSEIEEDSYGQPSSRHSSKLSLNEKKLLDQDSEWELGPSTAAAPLNHSAAHHRVSVRPKRTHGAPRRNRMQPIAGIALPTTPEVNEESSLRSLTPETSTKETLTELSSSMSKIRTETQLKCSSLPPGLAGPGGENKKLNRSRSSAGSKSQDILGEEDNNTTDKKSEQSIFARIFPRRSAKKKKNKEEITVNYIKENVVETYATSKLSDKRSYAVEGSPIAKPLPRSGAASRQRVLPIDIPASPEPIRHESRSSLSLSPSPLQAELENRFRQKTTSSLSSSPPNLPQQNRPESPKTLLLPHTTNENSSSMLIENSQFMKIASTKVECFEENESEVIFHEETKKVEEKESKCKVKIAGLSSLQQRVLLHDSLDDNNAFQSLNGFSSTEHSTNTRSITKSHSFKSHSSELKDSKLPSDNVVVEKATFLVEPKMEHSLVKATSLDSMKTVQVNAQFEEVDVKSASTESLESDSSGQTNCTEYLDSLNPTNGITISGPSHTSVVCIGIMHEAHVVDAIAKSQTSQVHSNEEPDKEDKQFSMKIQVKREQVKNDVPEFLNVHLHKVDAKPSSNVVLTTNASSPNLEIDKDGNKPKTVFNFDFTTPHKFSQDDIEIIDKESKLPNVIISSMATTPPASTRIYKKHSEYSQVRKSSLVSSTMETKKISLRTKSSSLDLMDVSQTKFGQSDITKQKTASVADLQDRVSSEAVVLRRKSLVRSKQDDEPELMKVFARRSLKLKDSDDMAQQVFVMVEDAKPSDESDTSMNKSRDSDKENQLDSPLNERKKSLIKEPEPMKEPFVETKYIETTEVTLRKPMNNKFFSYQQRTASLGIPKGNESNMEKVQKDNSINERPKTELNKTWINVEDKKIVKDDVILNISSKSDFINEDFPSIPKNFNQRKAEWEKRAQEALKKSVP